MSELLYDHREKPSGIPDLLKEAGIALKAEQLAVGDYIVSERVAVERKAAADFVASLKDGRLFRQAQMLQENFAVAIIVLEGSPRWKTASLLGVKSALARGGVSLVEVKGFTDTALFLRLLHRQENGGGQKLRRPPASRRYRGPEEVAEDSLAALPGISIKKAQALLHHFGSLREVTAAKEKELQEVPGIGKKTAADLAEIFSHQPGQVPW